MQIRFTANDADSQSIVESGVDAFRVLGITCQPPADYTLTVNVTGQGSYTLDPSGGVYPPDTLVQVEAFPDAGWCFDHWDGDMSGSTNPDSILMDADKSLSVVFEPDCNGNGVADQTDIAGGTSTDVNGSGVPDECESVGDTNCDGTVDFGDINTFVEILTAGATPCEFDNADINGDGSIDFGDINPFVTLITNYRARRRRRAVYRTYAGPPLDRGAVPLLLR
jgi:hypothetical protein